MQRRPVPKQRSVAEVKAQKLVALAGAICCGALACSASGNGGGTGTAGTSGGGGTSGSAGTTGSAGTSGTTGDGRHDRSWRHDGSRRHVGRRRRVGHGRHIGERRRVGQRGHGGTTGAGGRGGSTAGSGGGGAGGRGGTTGAGGGGTGGGAGGTLAWVGTWATGPQLTETGNNPPNPPGLTNNTLRQIVFTSISGSQARLRLSNEFGDGPVTMNAVHVALSTTGSTINTSTDKALTFSRRRVRDDRAEPGRVLGPVRLRGAGADQGRDHDRLRQHARGHQRPSRVAHDFVHRDREHGRRGEHQRRDDGRALVLHRRPRRDGARRHGGAW